MKIIDARYDLMEQWANSPTLHVLIDPEEHTRMIEEMRYHFLEKHRLFYAQHGDWITGYFHSGSDKNEGGYSGRAFLLKMADGTQRTIIGPWHSEKFAWLALNRVGMRVTIHEPESKSRYKFKPGWDGFGMGMFGYEIMGDTLVEALEKADSYLDGSLKGWHGMVVKIGEFPQLVFTKSLWTLARVVEGKNANVPDFVAAGDATTDG